jgi:uncharacterized protein YdhG (YjbR/CyaY superfamily)
MARAKTVIDAYIAAAPAAAQRPLRQIRDMVRRVAPEAVEIMSYRMPAFRQGRILINFAAFKAHIGVFPPVRGDAKLERALKPWMGPKGNLQLPLGEPLPLDLLERVVTLRLAASATPKRKAAKR